MKWQISFGRFTPTVVVVLALLLIWQILSWFLVILEVPLAQSKIPYLHELAFTFSSYSGTLFQKARLL